LSLSERSKRVSAKLRIPAEQRIHHHLLRKKQMRAAAVLTRENRISVSIQVYQ
jgi:hypothetical protein